MARLVREYWNHYDLRGILTRLTTDWADGRWGKSPLWLRLIDQPVMDSVERQFEAVGNAELVKDIVEVVLYGLFADEELFADFAIAEALGDELNDFLFAFAEEGLFAALAGLGGFLEGVDHFGGHTVIEPDFAIVDLANAL